MKTYIGIDLGGTNVRVAKVTRDGEVLQELKRPSFGTMGPEVVIENLVKTIKEIDDYQSCLGIGIGVPGPVDTIQGKMIMATNLPGFEGFPVADTLKEATGIATFVDNDANVAGLAEALVGAGKGLPTVYYATISTGIGGALIVNGQVVSGRNGYAGEIGNLIVKDNGEKINALNPGAVENEASGTALTRKAKVLMPEKNIESAIDVFKLAYEKDEQALALVDQMAYDLARAFSAIAHVCEPYIFVIGGGVMNVQDLFLDKTCSYFDSLVHPGMRGVTFIKAQLEEPGIIGAAMLPISKGL
ncbi:MAG: ROK family protein [Erysipelotrichaceae bacterium]